MTSHGRLSRAVLLAALTFAPMVAAAQTPVESSVETRFQLDLKVPDAVLKTYLPEGFTSSVAPQGPAKDCNLRLVFIDRLTVNGPDGKPLGKGSSRFAYLVAPVKDASGANTQLVIGGLTADDADAPGPFGNFLPASTHRVRRTTTDSGTGPLIDTQDWVLEARTGEHIEMHIEYQRGTGNRSPASDVKFYSAKTPGYVQVSHQEQALDILRNTTTQPPDRVKSFALKISGGSYAKLFPGEPTVLSWDNILWLNRTVSVP